MNLIRMFSTGPHRTGLFGSLPALTLSVVLGLGCSLASVAAEPQGAQSGYRIEAELDESNSPVYKIYRGDRAVTAYHADLNGTPGFYPVLSPSGLPMTRNYSMQPSDWHNANADVAARFEREDHPHHRSMWFNHGEVNGLDFWANVKGRPSGQIVQRSGAVEVSSSSASVNGVEKTQDSCAIVTHNDWMSSEGKRLLSDERKFVFHEELGDTVMDVTIRLTADEAPVTLGDTKEGSFGVRMAGTMKVDSKLGGEIHNAEGLEGNEAWAQRSDWVDYSGPVAPADLPQSDAKATAEDAADWPRAGITMFYHPDNQIPECRWHVRSYGLFAANPFGRRHFGLPEYEGYVIEAGGSLTLNFRVVLHDGGFDAKKTAEHFKAYAAKSIQP